MTFLFLSLIMYVSFEYGQSKDNLVTPIEILTQEIIQTQREINWRNESLDDAMTSAEYESDGWTDEVLANYRRYVAGLRREIATYEADRNRLMRERQALRQQEQAS